MIGIRLDPVDTVFFSQRDAVRCRQRIAGRRRKRVSSSSGMEEDVVPSPEVFGTPSIQSKQTTGC